ncbi:general secretion pathway protein [Sphingobium sp. Leaf26]|nr:XrtA/PEP-CTERM system-associated ATPase [Sphingobium sp. Leaf26]KQN09659.1 general secretion pathway protein [Sphingobium sp. Leaf26]
MYDQYYGLQGRPFQLTPDPHYYFESATHRKALSYLGYGLAQGEGFIVITGDIGAGKTTLVGHLMQTIDPARLTAVKIVSTQVEGDDMLRLAAQHFGLSVDGQSKAAILHQVEGYLYAQARAGRRTLLIVDEAQNLPVSAIEELRMLSNFQLGGQSLLQIFLLGQPEFRDLIKSPELEQLRQRVIATHHLEPMMANEIEPYILHRLAIAGWNGNPAFTPGAFAALYAATGGVPRRLNALASRVLLLGAIEQLHLIDEEVVGAVVADMGLDTDVTPEPIVPSTLDTVEEVEMPDPVALVEEEPVEDEAAEEEDAADDVAPFAYQPAFEEPVAEDDVEDDAIELDVAWVQAEPVEPMADIVDPVEAEEDETPAFASSTVAPFTRPTFAPPRPVDFDADPEPVAAPAWQDEIEDAPVAEQDEPVQDQVTEVEDFSEIELVADAEDEDEAEPLAAIDAPDVDALRTDMLGEIEALRAEIASLRAMQAHAPFAQPAPAASEIDPEALKACFTLIEERLAALEFRAEEQDTALRRVLTLLVDWVEREERMADLQEGVAA